MSDSITRTEYDLRVLARLRRPNGPYKIRRAYELVRLYERTIARAYANCERARDCARQIEALVAAPPVC